MSATRWLALALLVWPLPASALSLEGLRGDHRLAEGIRAIAHDAADHYLANDSAWQPDLNHCDRRLRQPGAVFVTYAHQGKTRGCWGSLRPRAATLAQEIALSAIGALRQDYRHRPISRSEWLGLSTYVSLVGPLIPIEGPAGLSPTRDGLWLQGRGEGGVVLPGETRTVSRMLFECRRKAGLGPKDTCSLYRFSTLQVGPASEVL